MAQKYKRVLNTGATVTNDAWQGAGKGPGAGKPGNVARVLDILSRGNYASAEGVRRALYTDKNHPSSKNMIGSPTGALKGFWAGLSGKKKTSYDDVLAQGGMAKGWQRSALGLTGDIGLDPTTYMGAGLVEKAAKPIVTKLGIKGLEKGLVKGAEKAVIKGAEVKAGKTVAEDLAKNIVKVERHGATLATHGVPVESLLKNVAKVDKVATTANDVTKSQRILQAVKDTAKPKKLAQHAAINAGIGTGLGVATGQNPWEAFKTSGALVAGLGTGQSFKSAIKGASKVEDIVKAERAIRSYDVPGEVGHNANKLGKEASLADNIKAVDNPVEGGGKLNPAAQIERNSLNAQRAAGTGEKSTKAVKAEYQARRAAEKAAENTKMEAALGIKPKKPAPEGVESSAWEGGPNLYHGTSNALHEGALSDRYSSNQAGNLMGGGMYTTDAKSVAESYQKKGKGADKSTYSMKWNGDKPPKFADLDKPADASFRAKIRTQAEQIDGSPNAHSALQTALADKKASSADLIRKFREAVASEDGMTRQAADEIVNTLSDHFEMKGYDGLKHVGGIYAAKPGSTKHNVHIFLDPTKLSATKLKNAAKTVELGSPEWKAKLAKIMAEDKATKGLDPSLLASSKALAESVGQVDEVAKAATNKNVYSEPTGTQALLDTIKEKNPTEAHKVVDVHGQTATDYISNSTPVEKLERFASTSPDHYAEMQKALQFKFAGHPIFESEKMYNIGKGVKDRLLETGVGQQLGKSFVPGFGLTKPMKAVDSLYRGKGASEVWHEHKSIQHDLKGSTKGDRQAIYASFKDGTTDTLPPRLKAYADSVQQVMDKYDIKTLDQSTTIKNFKKVENTDVADVLAKHVDRKINNNNWEMFKDDAKARFGKQLDDPEIKAAMDRVHSTLTDDEVMGNWRHYVSNVMNPWRISVTSARPGFHIRNMMSDIWMNSLDDVGTGAYGKAARILKSETGGFKVNPRTGKLNTVTINGQSFTHSEIMRLYDRAGLRTGFFNTEKMMSSNKTLDKLNTFSDTRETYTRLAHFIDSLEKELKAGKGMESALESTAAKVRKFNLDYSDLTLTEKKIKQTAIPFYTFQRKAIPLMLEAVLTQPGKIAKIPKGMRAMENIIGSRTSGDQALPGVEEELPPWLKEEILLSIGNNKVMSMDLPPALLGQFTHNPLSAQGYVGKTLGSLSPLIKAPIELTTGKTMPAGYNQKKNIAEYLLSQTPEGRLGYSDDRKAELMSWLTGIWPKEVKGKSRK